MYPSKQDPIINYVLLPMYNNKNDREKPIIIQIKNRQRITLYKAGSNGGRYRPPPVGTDPATDPRRSVSAETESAGR